MLLRAIGLLAVACLVTQGAGASTIVIESHDCESPTYTVGVVTGNPQLEGQGGWSGYGNGTITTAFAHSGTQAMRTNDSLGKAMSNEIGPPPGELIVNNAQDWWVQAWVRIDAGGRGAGL